MVKCQGGTSPDHQPVLAISCGGRNDATNRPKVGIDHMTAITTTSTVTELLLKAWVKRSHAVRGRSSVASRSVMLLSFSRAASSVICWLIAATPLLVFYEYLRTSP